jgi:hypothetical protein
MSLEDLSDAELGQIVREGALWPILLNMEKAQEADSNGIEKGNVR